MSRGPDIDADEESAARPAGPLAVIDETAPAVGGGVCYAVVSGILLGDEQEARAAVRSVIPQGRRRPFHWHLEGVVAKTAMISALVDLVVVGRAVVVPCGRHRQEAARATALAATVEQLVEDGCDQALIEARTPAQDGRDRATILNVTRSRKVALRVAWEPKINELLWIADAIGGVVHAHLVDGDRDGWFEQLVTTTGLELEYRALPSR